MSNDNSPSEYSLEEANTEDNWMISNDVEPCDICYEPSVGIDYGCPAGPLNYCEACKWPHVMSLEEATEVAKSDLTHYLHPNNQKKESDMENETWHEMIVLPTATGFVVGALNRTNHWTGAEVEFFAPTEDDESDHVHFSMPRVVADKVWPQVEERMKGYPTVISVSFSDCPVCGYDTNVVGTPGEGDARCWDCSSSTSKNTPHEYEGSAWGKECQICGAKPTEASEGVWHTDVCYFCREQQFDDDLVIWEMHFDTPLLACPSCVTNLENQLVLDFEDPNTNQKENDMKNYEDMTLEELQEVEIELFQDGVEIGFERSAYESEEEYQEALAPVNKDMDTVMSLINNKHKEMNMNCNAITKAGSRCKQGGTNDVVVMERAGTIYKLGALPLRYEGAGFLRAEDLHFCGNHAKMLDKGEALSIFRPINPNPHGLIKGDIIIVEDAVLPEGVEMIPLSESINPNKEEDMITNKINCDCCDGTVVDLGACACDMEGGCGPDCKNNEQQDATPAKRFLCGNCRKKGVEDPYHNSSEEVRECYGAPAKPVKSGYKFFDRDDKQAAIIHAKTTGGTFKSTKDRKGWVVIAK